MFLKVAAVTLRDESRRLPADFTKSPRRFTYTFILRLNLYSSIHWRSHLNCCAYVCVSERELKDSNGMEKEKLSLGAHSSGISIQIHTHTHSLLLLLMLLLLLFENV
jgi:hypothetical protein